MLVQHASDTAPLYAGPALSLFEILHSKHLLAPLGWLLTWGLLYTLWNYSLWLLGWVFHYGCQVPNIALLGSLNQQAMLKGLMVSMRMLSPGQGTAPRCFQFNRLVAQLQAHGMCVCVVWRLKYALTLMSKWEAVATAFLLTAVAAFFILIYDNLPHTILDSSAAAMRTCWLLAHAGLALLWRSKLRAAVRLLVARQLLCQAFDLINCVYRCFGAIIYQRDLKTKMGVGWRLPPGQSWSSLLRSRFPSGHCYCEECLRTLQGVLETNPFLPTGWQRMWMLSAVIAYATYGHSRLQGSVSSTEASLKWATNTWADVTLMSIAVFLIMLFVAGVWLTILRFDFRRRTLEHLKPQLAQMCIRRVLEDTAHRIVDKMFLEMPPYETGPPAPNMTLCDMLYFLWAKLAQPCAFAFLWVVLLTSWMSQMRTGGCSGGAQAHNLFGPPSCGTATPHMYSQPGLSILTMAASMLDRPCPITQCPADDLVYNATSARAHSVSKTAAGRWGWFTGGARAGGSAGSLKKNSSQEQKLAAGGSSSKEQAKHKAKQQPQPDWFGKPHEVILSDTMKEAARAVRQDGSSVDPTADQTMPQAKVNSATDQTELMTEAARAIQQAAASVVGGTRRQDDWDSTDSESARVGKKSAVGSSKQSKKQTNVNTGPSKRSSTSLKGSSTASKDSSEASARQSKISSEPPAGNLNEPADRCERLGDKAAYRVTLDASKAKVIAQPGVVRWIDLGTGVNMTFYLNAQSIWKFYFSYDPTSHLYVDEQGSSADSLFDLLDEYQIVSVYDAQGKIGGMPGKYLVFHFELGEWVFCFSDEAGFCYPGDAQLYLLSDPVVHPIVHAYLLSKFDMSEVIQIEPDLAHDDGFASDGGHLYDDDGGIYDGGDIYDCGGMNVDASTNPATDQTRTKASPKAAPTAEDQTKAKANPAADQTREKASAAAEQSPANTKFALAPDQTQAKARAAWDLTKANPWSFSSPLATGQTETGQVGWFISQPGVLRWVNFRSEQNMTFYLHRLENRWVFFDSRVPAVSFIVDELTPDPQGNPQTVVSLIDSYQTVRFDDMLSGEHLLFQYDMHRRLVFALNTPGTLSNEFFRFQDLGHFGLDTKDYHKQILSRFDMSASLYDGVYPLHEQYFVRGDDDEDEYSDADYFGGGGGHDGYHPGRSGYYDVGFYDVNCAFGSKRAAGDATCVFIGWDQWACDTCEWIAGGPCNKWDKLVLGKARIACEKVTGGSVACTDIKWDTWGRVDALAFSAVAACLSIACLFLTVAIVLAMFTNTGLVIGLAMVLAMIAAVSWPRPVMGITVCTASLMFLIMLLRAPGVTIAFALFMATALSFALAHGIHPVAVIFNQPAMVIVVGSALAVIRAVWWPLFCWIIPLLGYELGWRAVAAEHGPPATGVTKKASAAGADAAALGVAAAAHAVAAAAGVAKKTAGVSAAAVAEASGAVGEGVAKAPAMGAAASAAAWLMKKAAGAGSGAVWMTKALAAGVGAAAAWLASDADSGPAAVAATPGADAGAAGGASNATVVAAASGIAKKPEAWPAAAHAAAPNAGTAAEKDAPATATGAAAGAENKTAASKRATGKGKATNVRGSVAKHAHAPTMEAHVPTRNAPTKGALAPTMAVPTKDANTKETFAPAKGALAPTTTAPTKGALAPTTAVPNKFAPTKEALAPTTTAVPSKVALTREAQRSALGAYGVAARAAVPAAADQPAAMDTGTHTLGFPSVTSDSAAGGSVIMGAADGKKQKKKGSKHGVDADTSQPLKGPAFSVQSADANRMSAAATAATAEAAEAARHEAESKLPPLKSKCASERVDAEPRPSNGQKAPPSPPPPLPNKQNPSQVPEGSATTFTSTYPSAASNFFFGLNPALAQAMQRHAVAPAASKPPDVAPSGARAEPSAAHLHVPAPQTSAQAAAHSPAHSSSHRAARSAAAAVNAAGIEPSPAHATSAPSPAAEKDASVVAASLAYTKAQFQARWGSPAERLGAPSESPDIRAAAGTHAAVIHAAHARALDPHTVRSPHAPVQGPAKLLCVMCLSAPKKVACIHSNIAHLSVCSKCAEGLQIGDPCPVCSVPIERWISVFSQV